MRNLFYAMGGLIAVSPSLLFTRVAATNVDVTVQTRQATFRVTRPTNLTLSALPRLQVVRALHPSQLQAEAECIQAISGSESVQFSSTDAATAGDLTLSDLDLLVGDGVSLRSLDNLLHITQDRSNRPLDDIFTYSSTQNRERPTVENRPVEVIFHASSDHPIHVLTQPPNLRTCVVSTGDIRLRERETLSIQASMVPQSNSAVVRLLRSEIPIEQISFQERVSSNIADINVANEQSAVLSANVRFLELNDEVQELGLGAALRLVAANANVVDFRRDPTGLNLRLRGQVSAVSGGIPERNLMPTRLKALVKSEGLTLWWGATGYVFALLMTAFKLFGFRKDET